MVFAPSNGSIPELPDHPQAVEVVPDAIPDELKIRRQWMNWRYAFKGGKWTKHPYNPGTGRKASSTELLTWSTFEEVMDAYRSGKYDGIGFVFSSGDPYAGVDLDDCRDTQTGEIEPWAAEIVSELDSYTELSPSGKGVHVIVEGFLQKGGKRGPIEMYDMKRFFTITGQVVEVVRLENAS